MIKDFQTMIHIQLKRSRRIQTTQDRMVNLRMIQEKKGGKEDTLILNLVLGTSVHSGRIW